MGATDSLAGSTTEVEDELLELYGRCKALLERDDLALRARAGARVATVGLWNAVNDLLLTHEQLLDLGA